MTSVSVVLCSLFCLVVACGKSAPVAREPAPVVVAAPSAEPAGQELPPDAPRTSEPAPLVIQEDGLEVVELAPGNGPEAKAGDHVVLHYDGTLPDGTRFDSSRERNVPFEFDLGRGMVIQGFERAVTGMRPGGKRRATIPPALGYGDRPVAGKIPQGATLIFEIELLEIR